MNGSNNHKAYKSHGPYSKVYNLHADVPPAITLGVQHVNLKSNTKTNEEFEWTCITMYTWNKV
jgi:hypothetical protein